MADITPREIRAMLQERLDALLGKLFPNYAISYPVFAPLNPTRNDKHPGSFVIWTRGAAAGGFNEYSPAGPPASGDVIDLIAYVHGRDRDRRFALTWARDFLGVKTMTPEERQGAAVRARRQAAAERDKNSALIAAKIAKANRLWGKTVPIAGSAGETYFASRRIPLMLIKNRVDDLRFVPRLEHWRSARWDKDRKVEDGPYFPAVIAAIRNPAGEVTGVHCTFIRADGSGKADVDKAKLMLGLVKGSFIRLTRGSDDGPFEEAEAAGLAAPLIIAEGIETGLSVALAVPEVRVAAAGSFEHMMAVDVETMAAEPIIYALDNDGSANNNDAAEARIEELIARGKQATFMSPSGAKDFNDVLTRAT